MQKVKYGTNHLILLTLLNIINVYGYVKLISSILLIGTALLTMSGAPNVRGLTIDTASDTQPIIDEWGTNDVSMESNYIFCSQALNVN